MAHACCGPGYASPEEAMQAEKEKLLYTIALYTGTGIEEPDYLATVDTYSTILTVPTAMWERLSAVTSGIGTRTTETGR